MRLGVYLVWPNDDWIIAPNRESVSYNERQRVGGDMSGLYTGL